MKKKAQINLNEENPKKVKLEKGISPKKAHKIQKATHFLIFSLSAGAVIGAILALIFLTGISFTGKVVENNQEGNIYGFIIVSGILLMLAIGFLKFLNQR